jgi:hypothetical protein
MLQCPKCDEPVNRQCKFCPHCGLPLADDALPQSAGTDPTLLGVPAGGVSDLQERRRRWMIYGAAGAAGVVALIGVISMAVSASRGGRTGAAARGAAPNPALYGNLGGMGSPLASVLGPTMALRPNYAPSSAPSSMAPISIPRGAPQQLAMRPAPPAEPPDLIPPRILLYRPNPPDQPPPQLAAPAAVPSGTRITPLPFIGTPSSSSSGSPAVEEFTPAGGNTTTPPPDELGHESGTTGSGNAGEGAARTGQSRSRPATPARGAGGRTQGSGALLGGVTLGGHPALQGGAALNAARFGGGALGPALPFGR